MRHIFILILLPLIFSLCTDLVNAQIDSSNKSIPDSSNIITESNNNYEETDDEFNLFLFSFATAFFCAIAVASFIGALAAIIFIFIIFSMVSAGIFSTSLVIGLYKKSFTAGFKTFLVITGMITGIFLGSGGLWIAGKIFNNNISTQNSLLIGAAGGCIGGILMGLIIFKALQLITTYFKKKLKL